MNRFVRVVHVNEPDQNEIIHLFESLCSCPYQQQPMTSTYHLTISFFLASKIGTFSIGASKQAKALQH